MRLRNNSDVQRSIYLPATGDYELTPPIVIAAQGGAIDVPDKVWNSVKDQPVVVAWLEEGLIVTGKAPAKPQAKAKVEPEHEHEPEPDEDEDEDGPTVDLIAAPEIADQMRAEGMTVATVAMSKPEGLTHLVGVGPTVAKKLIEAATAALG